MTQQYNQTISDVVLTIPNNSKFHSSLNEIDLVMGEVLLEQMRIADPRNISGKQENITNSEEGNWLWDHSRVFQVDELTTEEIFNTYLLRKKLNNQSNVDISYPLLGYIQKDIDSEFWGTGNRLEQWYFDTNIPESTWQRGDIVVITTPSKYKGYQAEIVEITPDLKCILKVNDNIVTEVLPNGTKQPVLFTYDDLYPTGDKLPSKFKAKSITGVYNAVVLCKTRDEAQYIRDKFMLRCSDGQIWHRYHSPTIDAENQLFTIFGIPNLERYPTSDSKLKGEGYIYGIAWDINIWGALTDTPLPQGLIEIIRMNMSIEREERTNRIIIS